MTKSNLQQIHKAAKGLVKGVVDEIPIAQLLTLRT